MLPQRFDLPNDASGDATLDELLVGEMASPTEPAHGSLPLEAFTKSTPPGWRPGVATYPIRRFVQLLRLWWRLTDLPEESAGVAMAGRLRGTAFQFAISLSITR